MVVQYHIIGASGRSGAALCRSLLSDGQTVVPVVRNAARWAATRLSGQARVADLADPAGTGALRLALRDATRIVSCAHARHVPSILAASPPGATFVFLGSTRKFTRWPDAHGDGVLAGEAAFLASGRPGVMLHPTMIYGAQGEDNVQRLARLLRWLPAVPLPAGGRALVQPIHQDDVTACLRAALQHPWIGPTTLVVAGPRAMTYRAFVGDVARAYGRRPPSVIAVPAVVLQAAARLGGWLPLLPRIEADEIRRLLEDKSFAIEPMHRLLGVVPRDLREGLAGLKQMLRPPDLRAPMEPRP